MRVEPSFLWVIQCLELYGILLGMPESFSQPTTARLFLDTEFTGFTNSQLLSLALVRDESCDFYGELHIPQSAREKNAFVEAHVLSQWGKAPTAFENTGAMALALSNWLSSLNAERIEVHYDYHTDMDLMERLLVESTLWHVWEKILIPTHIGYLYGDERLNQFMDSRWSEEELKTGLKAHHALSDARVLRKAFLMVHDGAGA